MFVIFCNIYLCDFQHLINLNTEKLNFLNDDIVLFKVLKNVVQCIFTKFKTFCVINYFDVCFKNLNTYIILIDTDIKC